MRCHGSGREVNLLEPLLQMDQVRETKRSDQTVHSLWAESKSAGASGHLSRRAGLHPHRRVHRHLPDFVAETLAGIRTPAKMCCFFCLVLENKCNPKKQNI